MVAVVAIVGACVVGATFGWFAFSSGSPESECACESHPMVFEAEDAYYSIRVLCRKQSKGPGTEVPRVPEYDLDNLGDDDGGSSLRN